MENHPLLVLTLELAPVQVPVWVQVPVPELVLVPVRVQVEVLVLGSELALGQALGVVLVPVVEVRPVQAYPPRCWRRCCDTKNQFLHVVAGGLPGEVDDESHPAPTKRRRR